jgi:hypothetical protein
MTKKSIGERFEEMWKDKEIRDNRKPGKIKLPMNTKDSIRVSGEKGSS